MTEESPKGPKRPPSAREAYHQATENADRWGDQTVVELLLATIEEMGELTTEATTQTCPRHYDDAVGDSWYALRRQNSAGNYTGSFLDRHFHDDGGDPLPRRDRPELVDLPGGFDPDALREEILDIRALMFQLEWSLDRYERQRWR